MSLIIEQLQKNLNKDISIVLKSKFRYTGRLLSLDDKHIKIDDFREGEIVLLIDSIEVVMQR